MVNDFYSNIRKKFITSKRIEFNKIKILDKFISHKILKEFRKNFIILPSDYERNYSLEYLLFFVILNYNFKIKKENNDFKFKDFSDFLPVDKLCTNFKFKKEYLDFINYLNIFESYLTLFYNKNFVLTILLQCLNMADIDNTDIDNNIHYQNLSFIYNFYCKKYFSRVIINYTPAYLLKYVNLSKKRKLGEDEFINEKEIYNKKVKNDSNIKMNKTENDKEFDEIKDNEINDIKKEFDTSINLSYIKKEFDIQSEYQIINDDFLFDISIFDSL